MNEATIRSTLNIQNANLNYRSFPDQFQATVTGAKGPTPGAITVDLDGIDVDLSQLTTPGFCRVMNLDSTNYVLLGVRNETEFYPIIDLLPGEHYVIRLSQYLGRAMALAGTGTDAADAGDYSLYLKSTGAPVNILVEAFEK